MKKWIIISLIGVLAIISGIYFMLESDDGQPGKDNNKKSIVERYASVLEDATNAIKLYNYQVTIEKEYYSKHTGDACCVVSIKDVTGNKIENCVYVDTHKNAIIMNVNNDDITTTIIGTVYGSGKVSMESEYVDGNAIIYIAASMIPEERDIAIAFRDEYARMSNVEDAKVDYLYLTATADDKYISADNMRVYISDSSILFSEEPEIECLSLSKKDGSSMLIVKKGSVMDGNEILQTDSIIKYNFKDVIDNEIIESIEINDKKYYLDEAEESFIFDKNKVLIKEYNGLKETFTSELNEANGTVTVTYVATWTKAPADRCMDWISLKWNDIYYIEGSQCEVVHKVYKKDIESNNGQWIVNNCSRADKNMDLYGLYIAPISVNVPIEKDIYDIGTEGMCIFIPLYEDTDKHVYVEETVEIEVELSLSNYKQVINDIYASYYHNEQVNDKNVAIGGECADFGNDGDGVMYGEGMVHIAR